MIRRRAVFALFTAVLLCLPVLAQERAPRERGPADELAEFIKANYTKYEYRILMRDGVKLFTAVYVPKDASPAKTYPIMLNRTPYSVRPYGVDNFPQQIGPSELFARARYIFAYQDVRGRMMSEGLFVDMRPEDAAARGGNATDESTDTYDAIDWLVRNVAHNNGKVGQWGISYPGFYAACALINSHPALKAVSPQASPADMFIGDDFHHNGAFRLSYGFEYAVMMESSKERTPFVFGDSDTYDWYLKLGSLAHINEKYLHGNIPSWNDFAQHPNYDSFWQRQGAAPYIDRVTVPTLSVAGWWDQEDFYGPITIYRLLERYDTKHLNYLVVGPWNHGGWSGDGRSLAPTRDWPRCVGAFARRTATPRSTTGSATSSGTRRLARHAHAAETR